MLKISVVILIIVTIGGRIEKLRARLRMTTDNHYTSVIVMKKTATHIR